MNQTKLSFEDYCDFTRILKNPGLTSYRDLSFVVKTELIEKFQYMSLEWGSTFKADTLILAGIYGTSMNSLLDFLNARVVDLDPTIKDRLHLFMESDNYILHVIR